MGQSRLLDQRYSMTDIIKHPKNILKFFQYDFIVQQKEYYLNVNLAQRLKVGITCFEYSDVSHQP